MKEVSRVIERDDSRQVHPLRIRVPLVAKALGALFLALLPLAGAISIVLAHWTPLGAFSPAFEQLFAMQFSFGSFEMPVSYVALILLVLAGLCIGLFIFEVTVIIPVRTLAAWVRLARERDFTQVPLLPALRNDEIGDIERLISSSSAYFSRVKDENSLLMEEKSLFVTVAAHQLRTPLTELLWNIDALLNSQTTDAERLKLMTTADATLKRMRLIINHILESAKVESGQFGSVFESADVVSAIEKLIEQFKPVAESRNVDIRFEHGEGLPQVYVDIERISFALFDLISNAVDYTPSGGSVVISAQPVGDRVEIAVADTGIGIAETEIPKLFEKFYRGDRARRLHPDGSGLGLFLAHNIISSHGSDIAVTSKEGSGARFSFSLGTKKSA